MEFIADAGLPDVRPTMAQGLPVTELPADVALYLNGSRYCETDQLGSVAWNLFGHLDPGLDLVQSICDFTHDRLAFDYKQARCTRTALRLTRRGLAFAGTSPISRSRCAAA
jgi:hypothetical protein